MSFKEYMGYAGTGNYYSPPKDIPGPCQCDYEVHKEDPSPPFVSGKDLDNLQELPILVDGKRRDDVRIEYHSDHICIIHD